MGNKELLEEAEKALQNAYAPYSKFYVGAAVLAESGKVYCGCNIENASFGATCCAERVAIYKAISEGERKFLKIAITAKNDTMVSPCGICRQVLLEFMPEGNVILGCSSGEQKVVSVKELLPLAFSFEEK